jgi:hypothetical protein
MFSYKIWILCTPVSVIILFLYPNKPKPHHKRITGSRGWNGHNCVPVWPLHSVLVLQWQPGSCNWCSDSLQAGRSKDQFPVGQGFLCHPDCPQGLPSLQYNGYWVFHGVKWPQYDADRPSPSAARLQIVWSYNSVFRLSAQTCPGVTFTSVMVLTGFLCVTRV